MDTFLHKIIDFNDVLSCLSSNFLFFHQIYCFSWILWVFIDLCSFLHRISCFFIDFPVFFIEFPVFYRFCHFLAKKCITFQPFLANLPLYVKKRTLGPQTFVISVFGKNDKKTSFSKKWQRGLGTILYGALINSRKSKGTPLDLRRFACLEQKVIFFDRKSIKNDQK